MHEERCKCVANRFDEIFLNFDRLHIFLLFLISNLDALRNEVWTVYVELLTSFRFGWVKDCDELAELVESEHEVFGFKLGYVFQKPTERHDFIFSIDNHHEQVTCSEMIVGGELGVPRKNFPRWN